ncbi:hypothetical protein A2331_05220 [Candidatus Falkowbacteria bacterium RIFOXYB2_FULL_34_18]|uniref:Nucleotidase n=1 Tax=Candidatus Falkowbacteria bacterium RIFOXYD2_FULL_34_120 TaxID=1798007 RepID=A0A1F5TNH5_9BACT|nr:MAG: hypothetical protein A2500_07025 [Candidatus Falkowbacteria bacterium RIFOXYC12_FULL_34_55]OGF28743.1 MAG: hypothetical protein A2331_05220 [Candidatus Falkowbacteria bacterium RIFOXYB2_FULL_34_18]OGF38108.1 MAG: hypothetical protein A2466_04400 [Candidatus Falkowbacteria bacterium RIFOXYC2_FULL_34_220]OGF38362.1 MAG: hypothetical protein A2515_06430 [Candidatus Falkowbacteria bacterium RIFOXYD12_FULL_34_57]OGF40349.1 MAG: hypothetical protein A2531_00690 [Candidatus Falkowbacteria bact
MEKKIAVFDLDDVIASTIDGIMEIIQEGFGIKIEMAEFQNFRFEKIPKISKRSKELENIIRTHEFFIERKILPGALNGLQLLSQKYINIISTARKRRLKKTSLEWCRQTNIDPFIARLYCGRHKPWVIIKENAEFFTDDNINEHKKMFTLSCNLQQIIVDKPWNQNFQDKRIIRSCGWTKEHAWRPEKNYPTILEIML